MALIEIDGLPINNADFPWQTVSHNQMVLTRLINHLLSEVIHQC